MHNRDVLNYHVIECRVDVWHAEGTAQKRRLLGQNTAKNLSPQQDRVC